MEKKVGLPKRAHPPHLPVRHAGNISSIVFVTVCTAGRRGVLATDGTMETIATCWQVADEWLVGKYLVMPDHVHLFCMPAKVDSCSLQRWISYWKWCVTRKTPWARGGQLWQRHFWDRQLRSGESYHEKWAYVRMNPVRKGLAVSEDDWPYQGEMNTLRWHDW